MRPLVSRIASVLGMLAFTAAVLKAHDLFLLPGSFFVQPKSTVVVRALNGSFDASEAAVDANRLRDLNLVSQSGRSDINRDNWKSVGKTAQLKVRLESAGTYLIGASTYPRTIKLNAKQFNEYLQEDGIPEVLAARKRSGEDTLPARERYSKHVKTLLQAGAKPSGGFDAVLGYPAELVPLANPYGLHVGQELSVRAQVDGKPAANQTVLYGGRNKRSGKIRERSVRTDASGVARIPLNSSGNWYVKFIHMEKVAHDSVDYESKWATLTFGVR